MASWDENRHDENSSGEDEHLEEGSYYAMLNVSTDVKFSNLNFFYHLSSDLIFFFSKLRQQTKK